MKVTSYAVARPVYYDRNSATKGRTYGAAGVAPHATTTRWEYTVPSGKAAYVETLNVLLLRDNAPTVQALAQIIIYIQSSDAVTAIALQLREYTTSTYVFLYGSQSNIALLKSGDVIYAASNDPSTGGTHIITADMKLTEFDA